MNTEMYCPTSTTTRRSPALAAAGVLLGALLLLAGCGRTTKSAEAAEAGFFTGYEIGDEQDRAKIREERPGYRRYE